MADDLASRADAGSAPSVAVTWRERWRRLRRAPHLARARRVRGDLHHELHGHEDARARNTFLLQILALVLLLGIPWVLAVKLRLDEKTG